MSKIIEAKLVFKKKPTQDTVKRIKAAHLKGDIPVYDFGGDPSVEDEVTQIGVITGYRFNKHLTSNNVTIELNQEATKRGCFNIPEFNFRINPDGGIFISYL